MRAKKAADYVLSFVLCCFIFLLLPMKAQAGIWTEVNTWDALVAELERDTTATKYIKVTGKIDVVTEHTKIDEETAKNQTGDLAYWKYTDGLVKVRGDVFLDLNGQQISYKWCARESGCLFFLESGCNMSILDTSAKKDGMIYFNGWTEQWNHDGFGDDEKNRGTDPSYMTNISSDQYRNQAQRRDVIHVGNGATLTMNAGTLRAGRGERQWVTYIADSLDGYKHEAAYSGWAWMVVNGSAVMLEKDASFTMNGGRLDANGYFYYRKRYLNRFEGTWEFAFAESAGLLFKRGSKVVINDGYLRGTNHAAALDVWDGSASQVSELDIRGGHFESDGSGIIIVLCDKSGLDLYTTHVETLANNWFRCSGYYIPGRIKLVGADREERGEYNYYITPKTERTASLQDSKHPEENSFDYVLGASDVLTMTQDGKMVTPYFNEGDYGSVTHENAYFWAFREKNAGDEYYALTNTVRPTVTMEELTRTGFLEAGHTYYIRCYGVETWQSNNSYTINTVSDPLEITILEEGSVERQEVKELNVKYLRTGDKIGDDQFGCDEDFLAELYTSIFENGINVVSVYGSEWEEAPKKDNAQYSWYFHFRTEPGYYFTANTKLTLHGVVLLETVSVSEDGRSIVGKVTVRNSCSHKLTVSDSDEVSHFQICTICGEVVDSQEHVWSYRSGSGSNTKYKCSECGKEKILGDNAETIYRAHIKLGDCFVGEAAVQHIVPYTALDTSRFYVSAYGISKDQTVVYDDDFYGNEEYTLVVKLSPLDGFTFVEGTTKAFCEINNTLVEAKNITYDRDDIYADFYFTPAIAPTVTIDMPADIKAGDDLILASTKTDILYNGAKTDMLVTTVYEDGELLVMNFRMDGVWTYADLDAYIAEFGAGMTDKELAEGRMMFTAKPGVTYSVQTVTLDTTTVKVVSSTPDRIRVRGADEAVQVTKGRNNTFSCCAVYVPQGSEVGDINLETTAPVWGMKPDISHGESWDTSAAFTCGKKYTVTFNVNAQGNQTFTADTVVTVNGIQADVALLSDTRLKVSYTFKEIPHQDKTVSEKETCTKDGYTRTYCKACNKELSRTVIPATGHHYTDMEAVEPTCISVGNVAYQVCEYCGDIICDRASVYLPPEYSNHVGGDSYYDAEKHWVLCACEKHVLEDKHTYDANGVCTVCRYTDGKIIVSAQPQDVQASAGDTVNLTVRIYNGEVTYQWEESTDGGLTWVKSTAEGNTTNVLTITVQDSHHDRKFRCRMQDGASEIVYSDVANIFVFGAGPAITSQPESVTVQEGQTAVFKVAASGTGLLYKWERCTSGTKWETITGTTNSRSVSATKEMNGWKFRVTITDTHGKMSTSNPATLTVIDAEGLAITKQPANVNAAAGETATFSVTAVGEGLTYQWEYKNASAATWSKSGAAVAKTANMTFTVGTDKTLNGRQYRCIVTDKNGKSVTSNAATLTVGNGPVITAQPANQTATAGATVSFKVAATGEGLTYQWEYKNASAATWSKSGAAVAKTANMTFTVGTDKTLNGRQYRCIVTDKNGKSVTSNAATLTVGTAAAGLAITSQPANVTAAVNDKVTFSVKATGEGLTYQWEYKNASAATWSKSGAAAAKTANMTFSITTDKSLNGRQYRCIVTDKNGNSVTSNAATLTVGSAAAGPAITSQPANVTAAVNDKVTFSVIATGEGLTYQWQYKNAGASDWSNSGAAAAKTANMTFTVGTDKTLNGRQYRCIVTDKNGSKVTSNAATLTVGTAAAGPAITSQPANVTAAVNDKVTFSVKATGEGLTYQWQYKNAGASTWSNSGAAAAKTANMTFTVGTDKTLNGRQYRCIVTDKNGSKVTSNAATLTVSTAAAGPAITSQPANVTAAVNDKVTFSVTATGEGLTYQWQYKNAGASTWSNSGAAAAKTANMTFTVGTDKTLNGRQYRCVVTDKNGNTVTSNAATLTVK